MSSDEMIIGSIRAQADRIKSVLSQIENEEKWKDNAIYYAQEIQDIERELRKIRKAGLEPINQ